jgi:hypothetical protein
MSLGENLGKDETLTDDEYKDLLQQVSRKLFGSEVATVLGSCLEFRPCPSVEFWRDLILSGRDQDLGANLLSVLLPWINITDLVCRLLEAAPGNNLWERQAGTTAWYAACGGSIEIPSGEHFDMKEAVDRTRLTEAIRCALQSFKDPKHRDSLQRALNCLSTP